VYALAGVAYLSDDIADVDYRVFLNPGLGYFFVKDDEVKFSMETGPSYVFQKQDNDEDNFLAWRIADRFEWKFSETGKIFQGLEFLLNTDDTDDYLINAEAGIEAALNSTLSLVLSVRDRFDASPAAESEKNDVIVTTGLKVLL
jgi:putative salt-induced outer membrane protein YdiY